MDYIEKKSTEDMLNIIINIEKYLLDDDYGNAFLMFLHLFSFKPPNLNIFLNKPRISITCKK